MWTFQYPKSVLRIFSDALDTMCGVSWTVPHPPWTVPHLPGLYPISRTNAPIFQKSGAGAPLLLTVVFLLAHTSGALGAARTPSSQLKMVQRYEKTPVIRGFSSRRLVLQGDVLIWSEWRDLNPRPLGPELKGNHFILSYNIGKHLIFQRTRCIILV